MPASAAGRAAALPRGGREGRRAGGRAGGRTVGRAFLAGDARYCSASSETPHSFGATGLLVYWVAGAVWLAWLPSATVWCVRVCSGGPGTLKRLAAAAGACRAISIPLALLVVLVPFERVDRVDRFLQVGGIHVSKAITLASIRKCLTESQPHRANLKRSFA